MFSENKAIRQVCDLDIRFLSTKMPFLFFHTANTTTTNISSESVFATAKGNKRISFQDPMDGTFTVEAQVYPFDLYALMSDGLIDTTAAYAMIRDVECTTAGQLEIGVGLGQSIQAGTVFAYPADDFGGTQIRGTFISDTFVSDITADLIVGETYTVGFMVVDSANVRKIAFNNERLPKDYYITALTVEKDEDGFLTPFKQIFYKAVAQRNFEITFSSEGDPAILTVTFDLMEDKNGEYVDFIEVYEDDYADMLANSEELLLTYDTNILVGRTQKNKISY